VRDSSAALEAIAAELEQEEKTAARDPVTPLVPGKALQPKIAPTPPSANPLATGRLSLVRIQLAKIATEIRAMGLATEASPPAEEPALANGAVTAPVTLGAAADPR
jgi:hypothetical protein